MIAVLHSPFAVNKLALYTISGFEACCHCLKMRGAQYKIEINESFLFFQCGIIQTIIVYYILAKLITLFYILFYFNAVNYI